MQKAICSALAILSVSLVVPVQAAEKNLMQSLESLSTDLANQIVVAAVQDCTQRGYKVSAAVVGREGNMLAFLRNPLSGPHTIQVSQQKAYTAASFQASTSALADTRPDLNFAPGALLIIGGVPISIAGKFYGGVAVAGAAPAIDEQCAQAGVGAVEEILNFAG